MLTVWKPQTLNKYNHMLDRFPTTEYYTFEDHDRFTIAVDLPGHDPGKIQVTSQRTSGAEISISSERENPRTLFHKAFRLPDSADIDRIEAEYRQGVLTISIPKREDSKPRTIEVKVTAGN